MPQLSATAPQSRSAIYLATAVTLLAIVLFFLFFHSPSLSLTGDETVLVGCDSTALSIHVLNPRKLGVRMFNTPDGRVVKPSARSAADMEIHFYGIEVCILARSRDGQLVCPVWPSSGGRYGWIGSVHSFKTWSNVTTQIGTSHEAQSIRFPTHKTLTEFYLLVRRNERNHEPGEWCVSEVQESAILNRELFVPDLLTLPRVSSHPLGDSLQQVYERAIIERAALRRLRELEEEN